MKSILSDINKEIADKHYIIKPDSFIPLLRKTPIQYLLPFLTTINELLNKFEHNAILFRLRTAYDFPKTDGLTVVLSIGVEVMDEEVLEQVCVLVQKLIAYLPPEVRHYEFVYQIASHFASKCLNSEELNQYFHLFKACLKLLQLFAKVNNSLSMKTGQYFYFTPGNNKISVNLPADTPWPFIKVIL